MLHKDFYAWRRKEALLCGQCSHVCGGRTMANCRYCPIVRAAICCRESTREPPILRAATLPSSSRQGRTVPSEGRTLSCSWCWSALQTCTGSTSMCPHARLHLTCRMMRCYRTCPGKETLSLAVAQRAQPSRSTTHQVSYFCLGKCDVTLSGAAHEASDASTSNTALDLKNDGSSASCMQG